jgi:hypothetical protein
MYNGFLLQMQLFIFYISLRVHDVCTHVHVYVPMDVRNILQNICLAGTAIMINNGSMFSILCVQVHGCLLWREAPNTKCCIGNTEKVLDARITCRDPLFSNWLLGVNKSIINIIPPSGHSKKVCFASEKYSKATCSPGNKTHGEKLHKMFTSSSTLSVFLCSQ